MSFPCRLAKGTCAHFLLFCSALVRSRYIHIYYIFDRTNSRWMAGRRFEQGAIINSSSAESRETWVDTVPVAFTALFSRPTSQIQSESGRSPPQSFGVRAASRWDESDTNWQKFQEFAGRGLIWPWRPWRSLSPPFTSHICNPKNINPDGFWMGSGSLF